MYNSENPKLPVKDLVRQKIVPELRKLLAQLGPAIIAEHGKDIQHPTQSNPSSGVSTPAEPQMSAVPRSTAEKPAAAVTARTAQSSGKDTLVNVTTVTDTAEFRTTAAELYQTFTDPQRLAAFTRSAPKVFEGAKAGGRFEIFGGNVSGEFVELVEPTTVVQRWRLQQWPAGHHSTLRIRLDQNDQDAVTVMRVDWEGVPIGQEEVTKRNWQEYYVVSSASRPVWFPFRRKAICMAAIVWRMALELMMTKFCGRRKASRRLSGKWTDIFRMF